MARIAGVNLPVQKHVWVGLQSIYGIGRTRSKLVCESAGVTAATKIRDLTEALIEAADDDYRFAAEGIVYLPRGFRRAAGVASAVYRGIHDAIRRNGYDNVRRRAYTSQREKLVLAAGALFALARPRGWGAPRARVAQ